MKILNFVSGLTTIEKYIFLYIFCVGLILTLVIPPFQKPDEIVHFRRTLSVSQGKILCQSDRVAISSTEGIEDLINATNAYGIPFNYKSKYPWRNLFQHPFADFRSNSTVTVVVKDICQLPFWGYLPQGLGIILGSLFHLKPIYIFYTGRLMVFFTSVFWGIFLLKRTPREITPVLLFVLALPMTLHQLGAYSYDPVHILTSLTIFSYWYRLVISKKNTLRQLIFLFFLIVLFVCVKSGGYEFFLFLPLFIPKNSFYQSSKKYLITIFSLIFTSITLIIFIKTLSGNGPDSSQYTFPPFVYPELQTKFLLNYPLQLLLMWKNTTLEMSDFYFRSLIGTFGWLDYRIDFNLMLLYTVIFGWICSKLKINKLFLQRWRLFFLFAFIFIQYLYLITIFYIMWTPVGADVSQGTQGRYFIVLLPFLFVVFSSLFSKKNVFILTIFILFYSSINIIQSIYLRYFDYSGTYKDFEFNRGVDLSSDNFISLTPDYCKNYQTKLNVSANKKLGALGFYFNKTNVFIPYELSIYNHQNRIIRKKIINITSINDGFNIIPLKPVKFTSNSEISVRLCPFLNNNNNVDTSFLSSLLLSDKNIYIVPIYLR